MTSPTPSTLHLPIANQTFDVCIDRPEDGKLVVLLRSFPESSVMWRRLMADLGQESFRCVAPDMSLHSMAV